DVNDRPRHLLVRVEQEKEGGARLLVKDAGVGIEPQNIERLFDAFYTTKSDGMGIGLSVSRSIIESHGGKLWAEANDGPGTTFLFSIPPSADAATDDRIGGGVWAPQLKQGRDGTGNSWWKPARWSPWWSTTTSPSASRCPICSGSSASRSRPSRPPRSSSRPGASPIAAA